MQPAPTFKVTPGDDELAHLERDLHFHPSSEIAPKTLSVKQIQQFNREGYLKGLRIFDPSEVTANREYFDRLLAKVLASGGDSYSISSAHLRYAKAWDLLNDPRLVTIVTDLLGPNVIGWGSHFFCKLPGDGKRVSWHQDASYWPLTPSKAVTIWLAIDDADRENACMRYIPGSHHHGHLTYSLSENDETTVLNQEVLAAGGMGSALDVELKAGEISLHSDLLLHGSEVNHSQRRRCGLTLRYCAADVVAHLGWSQKGVLVAGTLPDHWSDRPRPLVD